MAAKTEKFRGVENHKYAVEMHGLRSSGAAGSHDNRPKRERTRSNTRRAAIKQGW
jgi:hypothetical protein